MKLITDRIIVRAFSKEDAKDVNEYCSDKDTAQLAGWSAHESIEDSMNILNSWIEKGYHNAIVWKENGKVIGHIAIYPDSEENREDTRELGCALNKQYQRRGIMTEVILRIITELFDMGISNIWACCFQHNTASKKMIEKCGFVFQQEGTFYSESLKTSFKSYEYCIRKNNNQYLNSTTRAEIPPSSLQLQANHLE